MLRLRRCWRWAMVTAVTVDISISSWRKSHPLSEEHVAHTDEAEVSNKERTIQRLVDDRDMWRALAKTSLAERAEEAIARLRDAKPAHNSKGRGGEGSGVRDQERQRSVPSRAGDQC